MTGINNDNGPGFIVNGATLMPWWTLVQARTEPMLTVVLRAKALDWFEMYCHADPKVPAARVNIHLSDYQKHIIYERGDQVVYPYKCPTCKDIRFVTLVPDAEVSKNGWRLDPRQLPMGVMNSGAQPV